MVSIRILTNQRAPSQSDVHVTQVDSPPARAPLPETELIIENETLLRSLIRGSVLTRLDSRSPSWVDEFRTVTSVFVKVLPLDPPPGTSDWLLDCEVLHGAVSNMQSIVLRHEGQVCNFLMDDKGIIFFAAFGLPPHSHPDDPVRAVKVARHMSLSAAEHGISCSIGVCTGGVFAGVVGSPNRHEYTVIGESVNTSARLMECAFKDNRRLLVHPSTVEACQMRVKFENLGSLTFKGGAAATDVYRPLMSVAVSDFSKRNIFVGRTKELQLLEHVLQATAGSSASSSLTTSRPRQHASAVVIEGPAGIGKSTLLQHYLRKSPSVFADVWSSECDATRTSPLYAWRGIAADMLGVEGESSVEAVAEATAAFASQLSSPWSKMLPLLQALVSPKRASDVVLAKCATLRPSKLFTGYPAHLAATMSLMMHLIERRSQQGRLLLVIENIQWIDESSLALLVELIAGCPTLSVALTTTELSEETRRSYFSTLFSSGNVQRLVLEPLNAIESVNFAQHLVFLLFIIIIFLPPFACF